MITEIDTLQHFIRNGISLTNKTVQGIDFRNLDLNWEIIAIDNTLFLGCRFKVEDECLLIKKGAYILKAPPELPYNPFRKHLYHWKELGLSDSHSTDYTIYQHFSSGRWHPSINEALWQRIHDHAIDEALRDFIELGEDGIPKRKCVGIMGGHSTSRLDPDYSKVARIAKELTELGYLIVSGGGPGIMEAANLGAFMAHQSHRALEDAVQYLGASPGDGDQDYMTRAIDWAGTIINPQESLAIPTWFYGHEPSNVFSSHIAKYFSNSIREDTLLAICLWGVIFAPGSAGTMQEVFMDACQNHYQTYRFQSPMIFLGKDHYRERTLIYPALQRLAQGKKYASLLLLTDEISEVIEFVLQKTPGIQNN